MRKKETKNQNEVIIKERKKVFHDTETTGLNFTDRLVSSAFMCKIDNKDKFYIKEDFANEGELISTMATVTTGITYDDYKEAPKFEDTINYKFLNYCNKKDYIYVAYNAYFDLKMLEKQGIIWNECNVIDMYRVAKYVFKNKLVEHLSPLLKMKRKNEILTSKIMKTPLSKRTRTKVENFKLQYLRYLLEFDKQEDFKVLLKNLRMDRLQAHEAKTDIIIMYYLYEYIKKNIKIRNKDNELVNITDEIMLEISNTPILEEEINFGKDIPRGTKFSKIIGETYYQETSKKDRKVVDYLSWWVKNTDPMLDTYHSLKFHIAKGVVDEKLKYNKDFKGHLNYSIVFAFSKEDKRKAIKILLENDESKPQEIGQITDDEILEYENFLISSFQKTFQKLIKELESEGKANNEYDNLRFLLRNLNVRTKKD